MNSMTNTVTIEAMRSMRAQGISDAAIAAHFKVSRQYVGKLLGPIGNASAKRKPQIASMAAPESYSNEPLPTALRDWRARHGLTQQEAAKQLRVSNGSIISKWERIGHCDLAGLVIDRLKMEDALSDLIDLHDAGLAFAPKHTSDANIEYVQKCWANAKKLLTEHGQ